MVTLNEGAMALCRVCLVCNSKLLNLSNIHLAAYEKLTNNEHNIKTECDMPSTVCYVCHRQLQKFHMFSEMARKSNRILQDLLLNGTKVAHNVLTVQPNVILNLTLTPTEHLSLGDTKNTSSTSTAVKDEPIIESKEEETLEYEEYNMDESKSEPFEGIEINDDYNEMDKVRESDNNVNTDINNMHSCFNCDLCNRIFHKKGDLVKHLKFHTKEKPYSCNRCVKTFTTKTSLNRHMITHTAKQPYSCKRCGKKFTSKQSLTQHNMLIHTREKLNSCNISSNSQRPYACNRCVKTFIHKCHLTRHMQIHTGEKPYSCNRCELKFPTKRSLTAHDIHIHSGKKPYACNRCYKTFIHKFNLTLHTKIHTGEKPYSCDRCNMTFICKYGLIQHMPTHTAENSYCCNRCELKFSTKKNLTAHDILIHNREKPYACNRCDKTFIHKCHLTRHMKIHTDEKPCS